MNRYHILPVRDVGGEPCWIIQYKHDILAIERVIRRSDVEVFAWRYDESIDAYRVDPSEIWLVTHKLSQAGLFVCESCGDRTCDHWESVSWTEEGYSPREPRDNRWKPSITIRDNPPDHAAEYARFLGLSIPFTREQVITSFRRKALQVHPDRGGKAEDMAYAVEARDGLLSSLTKAKKQAVRPRTKGTTKPRKKPKKNRKPKQRSR